LWGDREALHHLVHVQKLFGASIDYLLPPYTKKKVQALDQWFRY